MSRNKNCIYSTVKNISGNTMRFGFLPPHGVQLTADEEYTVFGSILEAINRGSRNSSRRLHQAFANALDAGLISVIDTPAPILLDTVTGLTKQLKLASGSLSAADPCWLTDESDSNSAADVPA